MNLEQKIIGYKLSASVGGRDGLSAYQIACKNGFVGTEAEWLASLSGTELLGLGDYPQFDGNTLYSEGDIVVYEDRLWYFKYEHLGNWDKRDVDQVDLKAVYQANLDAIKRFEDGEKERQENEIQRKENEEERESTFDEMHESFVEDHERHLNDHTVYEDDHSIAEDDHTRANGDHIIALKDSKTALQDHETALVDHEASKNPIIGENKHWFIFDKETMSYVDSGVNSVGDKGDKGNIGDVYQLSGYMTAFGTNGSVSITLYKNGVVCNERTYVSSYYATTNNPSPTSESSTLKGYFIGNMTAQYSAATKYQVFIYADANKRNLLCVDTIYAYQKGDKGDPLHWSDLTPAQKAEIKGEKGDTGAILIPHFYFDDRGHLIVEGEDIVTGGYSVEEDGHLYFSNL